MKKEILTRLNSGGMEFESVVRLVFARSIMIIGFGLVLSITFWLFWLGNYSIGSFILGGTVGFFVFRIMSFLKRSFLNQVKDENLQLRQVISNS